MTVAYVHIQSDSEQRSVALSSQNTFGRHPSNSIQLLDRVVSKAHGRIDLEDERYVLRDLGSLNGTFLNGERVSERVLRHGDEILMGGTRLTFAYARESAADELDSGDDKPKLTLSSETVESHIRSKMDAERSANFIPAEAISDVGTLRSDYERLRLSYELLRSIGLELDIDKLLNKILDSAIDLLNASRGVMLLQTESKELELRSVRWRGQHRETDDLVLSRTIINEVLRSNSAVLSNDALSDQRFSSAKSIIMQGIRATMAVPLLHGDELFGVLLLDSNYASNAFSERDLQLLQTLANQAAVLIQNSFYAKRLEQEALTRQRFQKLLSPAIAEQVISGSVEIAKGGELRNVTIFFSDIRDFTAMSERKPAQSVVEMLNDYFESMVEIVFRHEGTLDKFVGDAIMAVFGAPVAHVDDPLRAVKTAIDMQHAIRVINERREARNEEPIRVGIGINSGEAVAGYLGSSRALEYTVIGDDVNISARLCHIAGPGEILISESTYHHVSDVIEVEAREPVKVKGKSKPLRAYHVLGYREALDQPGVVTGIEAR